eukprot:363803-Chlamydomonas_euryale.AAC.4
MQANPSYTHPPTHTHHHPRTTLLGHRDLVRGTLHVSDVGQRDAPFERRRPEVDCSRVAGMRVSGASLAYTTCIAIAPSPTPRPFHPCGNSRHSSLVFGPAGWFQNA